MKLLYCRLCKDVVKITPVITYCACKRSYGRGVAEHEWMVEVWGTEVEVMGITDVSLKDAITALDNRTLTTRREDVLHCWLFPRVHSHVKRNPALEVAPS